MRRQFATKSGTVGVLLDHFLACWEEELPHSLPLGHGGHYLYVGIGLKSSRYSVNLHSGGLQRGPGPADGHQEEGHGQQHHHHHDFHDARAIKLESFCV